MLLPSLVWRRIDDPVQGAQYTSIEFIKVLEEAGIQISMDGRGRALDNVWVERLWRTVKQEEVYIRDYVDGYDDSAILSRNKR